MLNPSEVKTTVTVKSTKRNRKWALIYFWFMSLFSGAWSLSDPNIIALIILLVTTVVAIAITVDMLRDKNDTERAEK